MDIQLADYILRKMQTDYDQIADDFSATRAFPWAEMKNLVEEYVQGGDRILDAGCGNGRLYELVKDRSVSYEGIDGSPQLIAIAKRKYGDHFAVKNLIDLKGYKEGSFSIIFCIATFQHIPGGEYRKQVLQNFHRLLLPDGYLVMINWNIRHQTKFKPYLDKAKRLLGGGLEEGDVLYPWRSQAETVYRYYHGFDPEEMEGLLEETGFAVDEQYYTRRGDRVKPAQGYNLVTIAHKK
ncbi:class I SAM-dependent methyltransferase [Patescibacteria group bacterium]